MFLSVYMCFGGVYVRVSRWGIAQALMKFWIILKGAKKMPPLQRKINSTYIFFEYPKKKKKKEKQMLHL